ncbi:MAG: hypothetical protein SFU86_21510 [Pirellulaceae bacterium]|nr:hypothetical protein [Pirellulaceae bacterium]
MALALQVRATMVPLDLARITALVPALVLLPALVPAEMVTLVRRAKGLAAADPMVVPLLVVLLARTFRADRDSDLADQVVEAQMDLVRTVLAAKAPPRKTM